MKMREIFYVRAAVCMRGPLPPPFWIATRAPDITRNWPSTITWSPGLTSPAMASLMPSSTENLHGFGHSNRLSVLVLLLILAFSQGSSWSPHKRGTGVRPQIDRVARYHGRAGDLVDGDADIEALARHQPLILVGEGGAKFDGAGA